jgi:hypothetical protein
MLFPQHRLPQPEHLSMHLFRLLVLALIAEDGGKPRLATVFASFIPGNDPFVSKAACTRLSAVEYFPRAQAYHPLLCSSCAR